MAAWSIANCTDDRTWEDDDFRLTAVVRFLGANGRSGPYRDGRTLAWGAYTEGNVCPMGAKHAGSR